MTYNSRIDLVQSQHPTAKSKQQKSDSLPLKYRKYLALAVESPELTIEWVKPVEHKDDGRTPNNTSAGSHTRVLWRCRKNPGHEWSATVKDRFGKGNGSPYCLLTRPLSKTHQLLASQWVRPVRRQDKGLTPYNTGIGSGVRVLWRCEQNSEHEWATRIVDRRRGRSCPYCRGKTTKEKSLASTHPTLAAEWVHPILRKNEDRTPNNTSAGSTVTILWRCQKNPDHEWKARVKSRSNGSGCPDC